VAAARLRLLDHRDRNLAEALHRLRVIGEELEQAVRAGEPSRSAADDGHPDVDALILGVELSLDELLDRVYRRRELTRRMGAGSVVRRHGYDPFLAFTASVSLGRILLRSPTMPRSENSKIGAFASLLMATMFSEDCIPTLCWMAPEIPAAR
jgi:hypothetical protein